MMKSYFTEVLVRLTSHFIKGILAWLSTLLGQFVGLWKGQVTRSEAQLMGTVRIATNYI